MLLLFDIGNTHTHLGLANARRVIRQWNIPTVGWFEGTAVQQVRRFVRQAEISGIVFCSVVPRATALVRKADKRWWNIRCLELGPKTIRGIGIDYPRPETIGPDRLANALAARRRYGAPVVVVDFGTAVTFDVDDAAGNYVGGIIAPGLNAMR